MKRPHPPPRAEGLDRGLRRGDLPLLGGGLSGIGDRIALRARVLWLDLTAWWDLGARVEVNFGVASPLGSLQVDLVHVDLALEVMQLSPHLVKGVRQGGDALVENDAGLGRATQLFQLLHCQDLVAVLQEPEFEGRGQVEGR